MSWSDLQRARDAGFGDGGHIRQFGKTGRRGHRECAQLAVLHERQTRRKRAEIVLDAPAEDVADRMGVSRITIYSYLNAIRDG